MNLPFSKGTFRLALYGWSWLVWSAWTACSATETGLDVRDADTTEEAVVDAGIVDRSPADPLDASREGADLDEPGDATAETSTCSDVFGPIYAPDADDPGACSADRPCTDLGLICFGLSCDERWECVPHFAPHPCPMEEVAHCGCNGVTFWAPNSCTTRPYAHIGACEEGTNCDPTDLRCSEEEPSCPPGTLASVVNGVYGPCVPFSFCRCEFVWECPRRERYACDRITFRCAELPSD